MAYDIDDYRLELSGDYKTLYVKERSSGDVAESHDLSSVTVKIEVISGEYHLSQESLSGNVHRQGFDISTSDTFEFDFESDKSAGGGLCTIDIRDPNAPNGTRTLRAKITFHLDSCPIAISYESGVTFNFSVDSPCDGSGCIEPTPDCWDYEEVEE
ncbi:MAG: hypothetical protein H6581_21330 [Bacteroidia bacterium]|nr:hypothetical protein [Bacteroidia bacterium]